MLDIEWGNDARFRPFDIVPEPNEAPIHEEEQAGPSDAGIQLTGRPVSNVSGDSGRGGSAMGVISP